MRSCVMCSSSTGMGKRKTIIDPENIICLKCRRIISYKKYEQSEKSFTTRQNWLLNNRESVLASKRKYAKTDKGKISLNKNIHKRRALKANNKSFVISKQELNKLYLSRCYECNSNIKIELDHIIPLTRGGSHSIGNIMPLCFICNRSKGNKTLMEWRLWKTKNI